MSMAYVPNKLLYVPNSVVWLASASPDLQIFDDVVRVDVTPFCQLSWLTRHPQGEKINTIKGHTAKVLSLYHWRAKGIVLSGGFDST